MKIFIVVAFVSAGCSAVLSHTEVLSATSMVPPILFAFALILVLLHLMLVNDRPY